jgi:hypothetical protein
MRILIACEFSGRVRDAFIAKGFDAVSCDLLDTEVEGPHIKGDVRDVLDQGWDLMIAHPPCTYLAVSGARWFKDRVKEQEEALEFVKLLLNAPIKHIALENPIGVISTKIRRPDQKIHPWMFGGDECKNTCLWLKNLPLLKKSVTRKPFFFKESVFYSAPSPDRWKERSRTSIYIAEAMASQWGNEIK